MSAQDKLAVLAYGFGSSYENPWGKPIENRFKDWGYEFQEAEYDGLSQTFDSPVKLSNELNEAVDSAIEKASGDYDSEDIVLAAFSNDGIFARYSAEIIGNDSYDNLFTLQCLHRGSEPAKLLHPISGRAEALNPDGDFLQELNSGGVSEEKNYINVYAPDLLMIDSDRAKLPEDSDNVENIKIGSNPYKLASDQIQDIIDIGTRISQDLIQDFADSFEVLTEGIKDPFAPFKKENRPRIADPNMVGLRAGQLYNASKLERGDVLIPGATLLYNDRTWEEAERYLKP